MKFKVVSESKRTLERVFDAGLLLVFIGILLQRDVSGDFIFFWNNTTELVYSLFCLTERLDRKQVAKPDLSTGVHNSGFCYVC